MDSFGGRGGCGAFTCRLSWQTAQGGSRGAGEWAEKGQGTLHPLYPRGSTVVSSGRADLVDRAHFQASVA